MNSWLIDTGFILGSCAVLLTLCASGWAIGWRCVLSRFSVAQKLMREVFGIGQSAEHKEKLAAARAKRLQHRSIRAKLKQMKS